MESGSETGVSFVTEYSFKPKIVFPMDGKESSLSLVRFRANSTWTHSQATHGEHN